MPARAARAASVSLALPAVCAAALLCLFACAAAHGADAAAPWAPPRIDVRSDAPHPRVAATPDELARLKAALAAGGDARAAVAGVIANADKALAAPLDFPPRGGQHNQWYQCTACQMGLKTVDPTHHQCPKCKKVYTGEPYDDVVYERVHYRNLRACRDAAWAWALTGDRKYADFAARVLEGYAQRYRAYPFHDSSRRTGEKAGRSGGHLFEQTLNESAEMTQNIAPAYDLVHDALSEAQRKAIADGLLMPMLETIGRNKAGKSNWQTWHNAAMIWGGAVLGDAAWVRRAVEDPENGFLHQMEVSVSAEGMWYENSWGYHFYTYSAMEAIAEGARRLGADLWGHPALRKMTMLPIRYAMPDGSLPRFGDDVSSKVARIAYAYAAPAAAYREPLLLGSLLAKPSWDMVALGLPPGTGKPPQVTGSEVFPGAGHAILRTGGPAGLAAVMTFGPYGGFHGHYDKLSFVLFGHGREIGVDPGRAASQAYRLPIHSQWYKATVSHNTVLVDGVSQKPAAGRLEAFAANADWAGAVASCDAAYPGVRHTRWLILGPTYVLVVDELSAPAERRFDWLYHNRGSEVRCDAATAAGTLPQPMEGAEYVHNVRAGRTDAAVRITFADKGLSTHLTAAGSKDTGVFVGDGVGASVLERVPMAVLSRRGKSAVFACVLEPVADGGRPAVTDVRVQMTNMGPAVTVSRGEKEDVFALPTGGFSVNSGGKVVLKAP